ERDQRRLEVSTARRPRASRSRVALVRDRCGLPRRALPPSFVGRLRAPRARTPSGRSATDERERERRRLFTLPGIALTPQAFPLAPRRGERARERGARTSPLARRAAARSLRAPAARGSSLLRRETPRAANSG